MFPCVLHLQLLERHGHFPLLEARHGFKYRCGGYRRVVSSYLIETRKLGATASDLGKQVSSGKDLFINSIKSRETVLFYYRGRRFSRYVGLSYVFILILPSWPLASLSVWFLHMRKCLYRGRVRCPARRKNSEPVLVTSSEPFTKHRRVIRGLQPLPKRTLDAPHGELTDSRRQETCCSRRCLPQPVW